MADPIQAGRLYARDDVGRDAKIASQSRLRVRLLTGEPVSPRNHPPEIVGQSGEGAAKYVPFADRDGDIDGIVGVYISNEVHEFSRLSVD